MVALVLADAFLQKIWGRLAGGDAAGISRAMANKSTSSKGSTVTAETPNGGWPSKGKILSYREVWRSGAGEACRGRSQNLTQSWSNWLRICLLRCTQRMGWAWRRRRLGRGNPGWQWWMWTLGKKSGSEDCAGEIPERLFMRKAGSARGRRVPFGSGISADMWCGRSS